MRTTHRTAGVTRGREQRGAALVVTLVLLLILTVLSTSTMTTASMETRMAANTQFYENAFQLAETGLDTTIAALNAETIAPPPAVVDNTCADPDATVVVAPLRGSYQTQLCFIKAGLSTQSGAGSSVSGFQTFFYQASAQGVAQSSASSLHVMGISKLGPSP